MENYNIRSFFMIHFFQPDGSSVILRIAIIGENTAITSDISCNVKDHLCTFRRFYERNLVGARTCEQVDLTILITCILLCLNILKQIRDIILHNIIIT